MDLSPVEDFLEFERLGSDEKELERIEPLNWNQSITFLSDQRSDLFDWLDELDDRRLYR